MFPPTSWKPAQPFTDLGQSAIHVWRVDLNQPEETVGDLQELLDAEEQARGARYRNADLRRRFTVSHAGLRLILAGYLSVEPHSIIFQNTLYGKPQIDQPQAKDLAFSLSHSGEWSVIAIARQIRVGIDLEYLGREVDYQHVSGRFFSVQEQAELNQLPNELRREAFLRAWVQKEAYLKALGRGLTRSLVQVHVSIPLNNPVDLVSDQDNSQAPGTWHMYEFEPAKDYIAVVACDAPAARISTFTLLLDTKHF